MLQNNCAKIFGFLFEELIDKRTMNPRLNRRFNNYNVGK